MKEEYRIKVETIGELKHKKECNIKAMLTPREYLNLFQTILNFTDDPEIDVPSNN